MSNDRILVTGANGRLGRTVLRMLGAKGVAGVRRTDQHGAFVHIDSDGRTDPSGLAGIRGVINCAGAIGGTREALQQANVAYPVNLAALARQAGVVRFVQVSSFALFGRASVIDRHSIIAPDGDYGETKAEAERRLQELEAPDFSVAVLRVPFIFSAEHPGVLGKLISTINKIRVLPIPAGGSSRRSVITYDMAARVLIELAQADDHPSAPLSAADPQPLDLEAVARTFRAKLDRRIVTIPVPQAAVKAIEAVAPRLGNRLFRSSILDPSLNIVTSHAESTAEDEMLEFIHTFRHAQDAP